MARGAHSPGAGVEDGVSEATRRRIQRSCRALLVAAIQFGALALIVGAAYALVVLGIGDVPTARQWTLIGFSALAAAMVAVVYSRSRARIRAWAEALVDNPERAGNAVVKGFSARVSSGLPVGELLPVLVESLRSGVGASAAEIWTPTAGRLELALADPARPCSPLAIDATETAALARAGVVGRSWLELWLPALLSGRERAHLRVVSMVHDGELIGLIVVERDGGRAAFSGDDDETLALLARQAALAFRTVRLGSALDASLEELRASRARVVAAGDAERRRIERDLHDGAQQHLLGLAVNLRVARELATSDPGRAAAILSQLSTEVHAAIDELRDLAHGIYPPLLAERGLAEAVRGAVARAGVRGSVVADGIGRYPAPLESTAYFCCVEAIQNAAKHAPGARVTVRLWAQDRQLRFEISDDGPGFDATAARASAGLTNMRDRAGALGGTLDVDAGGGTCVSGALPLVTAAARPDTRAQPSPAG
jgi:signal transduction histidine kinase